MVVKSMLKAVFLTVRRHLYQNQEGEPGTGVVSGGRLHLPTKTRLYIQIPSYMMHSCLHAVIM